MAQMFYVSREWKQISASMYTKHVSDIISIHNNPNKTDLKAFIKEPISRLCVQHNYHKSLVFIDRIPYNHFTLNLTPNQWNDE